MNPSVLVTCFTVAPSERVPIKTKILKPAIIQSIPETLHLSLRSIQPTLFLIRKQKFIEVTHTHPRQRGAVAQSSKENPGVFLAGCIRISIEIRETPGVIHSLVNNNINVEIGESLNIHSNLRFPVQSKATTCIDTWNKEKISNVNLSTNSFQSRFISLLKGFLGNPIHLHLMGKKL